MKDMNRVKVTVIGVIAALAVNFMGVDKVQAQEFKIQGDLVSSYVWRGFYQTGVSFQPTLGFGIGGFSLTAWGSTDFDGTSSSDGEAAKEIDLTAAYTFGDSGLTLSVASLWWAGQGSNKYFNFKSHETAHHFEAGLAYTLPLEKFPLSIAWYTMFAGADKNEKGEQNYSSYVELNYPFSIKSVDLNATCGFLPYEAGVGVYGVPNSGFAVTNLALKATKDIKVTDICAGYLESLYGRCTFGIWYNSEAMSSREESVQHFLDLIKKSRRGKFKVYIGMIAGVGKTYRMLQEAHDLLDNGVDVNIGYVETHGRAGTEAVLAGLPVIPRRKIFYKGKELEEMDLDTIIRIHPEIVIVDELAHTNVEGSRNEKRWQDVMDLLDEGINVISAVNIQHIESINEEVQGISGIEVKERIPDSVLEEADEVVNIDLTAEELITRLKAGKIYKPDKVALALNNFFKTENILQLRELALKEVALRVEKKVENEVVVSCVGVRHEKFMACISSHEKTPRRIIRKAARLATRYNTSFVALYVQTPRESADRIALANQRHLLNHFKLVTELGGEVMQVQSKDVPGSIVTACKEKQITTVCMGSPSFALPQSLFMVLKYRKFVNELAQANIDLIILA